MSCHDIGRGLNSVSGVVIQLYEEGRFDVETAKKLLHACREGVYWCDGNESEAVADVVDAGYCGLCMKKTEQLSNVYDNELGYPECYKVFKEFNVNAAHYYLCPECKKKVLDSYCQSIKEKNNTERK